MNEEKNFISGLHGLRGLASIGVFFGHSVGGYNQDVLNNSSFWLKFITNLGTFGVEVFFVLSGFVISNSIAKLSWRKFMKHRFWRIYPVFVFFTLMYFVLNSIFEVMPGRISYVYLINNLVFINLFLNTPALTPNAWTITYEVWFYVICFFLLTAFITNNKTYFLLTIFATSLFVIYYPVSIYFFSGVALNYWYKSYLSICEYLKSVVFIVIELFIVVSVVLMAGSQDYVYEWDYILGDFKILALYMLTVFLMLALLHPKSLFAKCLATRTFLFLGTISYSLYLSHPYPYYVIKKILFSFGLSNIEPIIAVPIFLLSLVIVVIPFAYVIFYCIEIRIYKWATGRTIY